MLPFGMVVDAGVILGGRYQLMSEIGRGGMGTVWSAKRIDLDAVVAVKLMKGDVPPTSEALERFRREAKSAAALRGPHVVQILDYGVDEASGLPFITMELLEGESLRQRLDTVKRLPPAQTANLITQAARGLSRAHAAGIMHRDLKPENVFLVENEDAELVKLLDFGIAKAEVHSGLFVTATGTVIGTPHYMSPEQVEPSRRVDYRTDIWSLGVIAAECLLGQRPFQGDTLQELAMKICLGRSRLPSTVCSVPVGFDAFFARACAVDPERRFQSATELARALSDVCTNALTPPPGEGAVDLGATVRLESSGGVANLARSTDAPADAPSRSPHRRLGWAVAAAFVFALVGGGLALKARLDASITVAPPAVAPPAIAPSATASPSISPPLEPTPKDVPAPSAGAPPEDHDGVQRAVEATAQQAVHETVQEPAPAPAAAKPDEPRRGANRLRDPRRTPPPPKPIDAFDLQ
jgi:eukaryotic-like serine/threonine-protein kinase